MERFKKHESMRGYFSHELANAMDKDPDIWLLTADLGFGMFDRQRVDHPDRFINCGAAETAMMGIAAGLAKGGKKPFTYTITSFYVRAAEPIALYVAREKLPVVMIGGGRDGDYKRDGFSHHAGNAQKLMDMLKIPSLYPEDKESMAQTLETALIRQGPVFISLRR